MGQFQKFQCVIKLPVFVWNFIIMFEPLNHLQQRQEKPMLISAASIQTDHTLLQEKQPVLSIPLQVLYKCKRHFTQSEWFKMSTRHIQRNIQATAFRMNNFKRFLGQSLIYHLNICVLICEATTQWWRN